MSHHPRNLILIIELALAGACFILVFYHLWLASGRFYRKAHFWIASWCGVSGICILLRFFQLTATCPTEAIWSIRWYAGSYAFVPFLLLGVLSELTESSVSVRWFIVVFVFGVILAVVSITTPLIMSDSYKLVEHLFGHMYYQIKPSSIMGPLFLVTIILSFIASFTLVYQAPNIDSTLRKVLLTLLIGYAVIALHSALVGFDLVSFSILEFSFPFVSSGLTYFVVWRYRQLQDTLETLVEEQTKQLAYKNEVLDRALQKSEATSKAKISFLANMSHELRTPMNGVLGLVEMLADSRLDREQLELVEAIRHSGGTLLNILNDLLDLSKVESGKMTIEMVPFSIEKVIQNAIRLLEVSAREKGLHLSSEIDATFPRAVLGDAHRLQQVVLNLVSNAIKYTEEGHVLVRVRIHSWVDDHLDFSIDIEDSGIGIGLQEQEFIFDKFTQVDASTTRVAGGAGLGLSISKQLVTLMGGRIELQSELGKGSVFSIHMKMLISKHEPVVQRDEPLPPFSRSLSVLVVEDNRINQIVARRILEKLGCRVEMVENGQAALEILAHSHFDAILMDCLMPVMDGFEATKSIRQWEKRTGTYIPIIAMTANAVEGDRELCLSVGMDDYISKPITARVVRSKIAHWCQI